LVIPHSSRSTSNKTSTPKHWKKSISRSYTGQENQENSQVATAGGVHSSLNSFRSLPPLAPSRPMFQPKIIQPGATDPIAFSRKVLSGPCSFPCDQVLQFMPSQLSYALPLKPVPLHEIQPNGQISVDQLSALRIQNSSQSPPNSPEAKQEAEDISFQSIKCQKTLNKESGYQKHQKYHTSNRIQKDLSCPQCQKEYNSQSALKMHIRTHTLPCKCPDCGKSFSRPWLLQGHMRTHSGEKPFACTHCARTFADKSNLRAHLQTHLQNKKYSCPGCQRSFSRMGLLNKHTDSGCQGLQTRQVECADALVSLSAGGLVFV
jgi:uncharacterized Zn-finger protein